MLKKNSNSKRIQGKISFEPKENLAPKMMYLPEYNCEMSLFKRQVTSAVFNTCKSVEALVDERIKTFGHEDPRTVFAAAVLDAISSVKVYLFVNINNIVLQITCANGYVISINPRMDMTEQMRIAVLNMCG